MRLQGRKVLVSQREPLIATDVRSLLEDVGATVVLGDGPTLFKPEKWDCAVLDGRYVPMIEELRRSKVPLLFYTGSVDRDAFKGSIYLTKPARDEEIIAGVLRAINVQPAQM